MNASTRESLVRGSRAKSKSSPGWMAFDIKQRQKQQGTESGTDSEAYPALSGRGPPKSLLNKNGALLEKPFSSVVIAPMNFPSLVDAKSKNSQKPAAALEDSCLGTSSDADTAVATEAHQKLKSLHPWADASLIHDVLAGVNNNIDEALSLLESMLISEKEAKNKHVESMHDNIDLDGQDISLADKLDMSFLTNDGLNASYKEIRGEAPSMVLLDAVQSLPIEPEFEWEEDDVYLIHRKDAMRMTRLASRHSKAANDAYLRGDHLSAHHFSLRAQEEWIAAEKLNSKAAKNILMANNSKNDLWTLDLHGLHSGEAVQALRDHLKTVESLMSSSCFTKPNEVHKEHDILSSTAVQSRTHGVVEKIWKQHSSSGQRPMLLQVITGKGNHSRGAAAIPSAITNFLSANGYHFDEARPGMIMVRPKFQQQ